MAPRTFAELVRTWMAGRTYDEAAPLLNRSPMCLWGWCNAGSLPGLPHVPLLARGLGVRPDALRDLILAERRLRAAQSALSGKTPKSRARRSRNAAPAA